jgi:hypothetical protein
MMKEAISERRDCFFHNTLQLFQENCILAGMKKYIHFFGVLLGLSLNSGLVHAQYPPPPGHPGTTAIYKDSSVFYAWATGCSVVRGYVNISDTNFVYNNSNRASYGNIYMATGPPDGLVLSLGDGGMATLTFDTIIQDQPGWDFAVFENAFSDSFLELAFVEVSSDGINFVRFPSVSLTQTQQQIGTFDTLDARKLNNLAGKYRLYYGTPFDLNELKDSPGIDIHHITTIRVIDVVGCIQDAYARYDSQGHKINDPFPTPFDTGGFDLDGVGLIHNNSSGVSDKTNTPEVKIIPNPCRSQARFFSASAEPLNFEISDIAGHILLQSSFLSSISLNVSDFPDGIYFVTFTSPETSFRITKKLLKY